MCVCSRCDLGLPFVAGALDPFDAKGKEGGKEMVFVFQPEQSVFADRIEEADSGSYFDDEVLRDMLTCDFERMQEQDVSSIILH